MAAHLIGGQHTALHPASSLARCPQFGRAEKAKHPTPSLTCLPTFLWPYTLWQSFPKEEGERLGASVLLGQGGGGVAGQPAITTTDLLHCARFLHHLLFKEALPGTARVK